ncbi:MAG: Ig-like domain-containing protein, partial [Burkholderiales bacterium]
MNLRIATCSVAVSAAFAGLLPLNAAAAPTVSFVKPSSGATLSGNLYQSSACEVRGTNIERVRFYLDSTSLNTEETGPWNCNLDTRKFSNGGHTLRAVAYDRYNTARSTSVSVTIQNGTSTPTTPPPTSPTGPSVSWNAPADGATLKGSISMGSTCQVSGTGISRVIFHLDGTQLNTELSSPWQCTFDTRKFADGAHTLKAVAYNSSGASTTITRAVAIQNGTTTPPPPGTTNPTVSFKSPLSGQTISGSIYSTCEVVGSNFNKVVFSVDGTAISTKNMAPWNCNLHTDQFADGTHSLMAVATNAGGGSATTQISLNFKNGTGSTPPPTDPGDPGTPPPTGGLPSTGTKAVATFESLGVYWTPGTNPGSPGCEVQFRKQGESAWKKGLNLWYDSRNGECRGSLVHLAPGTSYEVQLALPGKAPSRALIAKTWSESFPIARSVRVASGSGTLRITEGGTKDGYVLYT